MHGQRLSYLGSVDDKVLEYEGIKDPERQLLQTLFFSALLGDPLILNDGYLLHSEWGRDQLATPTSAVRQLNASGHLFLASRSKSKPSEWVSEQAKRTHSYTKLNPHQLELVDEAVAQANTVAWPRLNLQELMLKLLREHAEELLEREVPAGALKDQLTRFEDHLKHGTVRASWEAALLAGGRSEHEKAIMMQLANEVYSTSFACGFAGENLEVSINGFGRRRLQNKDAYRQEEGEGLAAAVSSLDSKSLSTLRSLSTIYVSNREATLCEGSRLAEFLSANRVAKEQYRRSVQNFLRQDLPAHERTQGLEQALSDYREALLTSFRFEEPKAVLRLLNLASIVPESLDKYADKLTVASDLIGMLADQTPADSPVRIANSLISYIEQGTALIRIGLPAVRHVYMSTELKLKTQPLDLLPVETARPSRRWFARHAKHDAPGSYGLALSSRFVKQAVDGIPHFNEPA